MALSPHSSKEERSPAEAKIPVRIRVGAQKMEKVYNHKKVEKEVLKIWRKENLGNPEKEKGKTFCIIMPPPNANGRLHMGHALMLSIQDTIVRYQRMKGKKVLWLPGFDHAGFETLVVFEKELEKRGLSRFEIPKEGLYEEILKFTNQKKKEIRNQMKELGISCAWKYEKYTLDKDVVKLVLETFKRLKDDGLIEKSERLVNWCPKHKTAFSDLEVIFKEKNSFLYYIKYGPFEIATVRPETILGDVAFAVNPQDERYKSYLNKKVKFEHPLTGEKVSFPVVFDKRIDPNFGTGIIKVTPGHDFFDFELAKKFNLPIIHIFDENGKINLKGSKYYGMNIKEAREVIVKDLELKGLLIKKESYLHSVPVCYKCESEIEPRPMEQWFLLLNKKFKLSKKLKKLTKKDYASLKEIALAGVKLIKFEPPRFKKILIDWLKQIKDWNISRQVVWGIKIPNSEDVFDTWFSSSQWPVVTLKSFGNNVFKKYYPTDVMETGYDILQFWVSRMIFMGLYLTGDIPFKKVILHGIVRDEKGQKMSKSKGNVIDPIDIVQKYGADTLRLGLLMGNEMGKDVIVSENKFIGAQRFLNKIWNATRFLILKRKEIEKLNRKLKEPKKFSQESKKILKDFEKFKKEILTLMEKDKLSLALEKLYKFFWFTFADQIIENTKKKIAQGNFEAYFVCERLLKEELKLLHPFLPFLTEYLWKKIGNKTLLAREGL